MKNYITLCLFLILTNISWAQKAQDISTMHIDKAIKEISSLSTLQIPKDVKIVGIGDVATYIKETQKFNYVLIGHLITNKNFTQICIDESDWMVRPLNHYLQSDEDTDTIRLVNLVKQLDLNNLKTQESISFLIWLKEYNLKNMTNKVNLYGVGAQTHIPAAYYLSSYISLLDQSSFQKFNSKWNERPVDDPLNFYEIEIWCDSMLTLNNSSENKRILNQCKEDLMHNKSVIVLKSLDEKIEAKILEDYYKFLVNFTLNKSNSQKTIYLSSNNQVARVSNGYISVKNQKNIPSVGKLLDDALKDKYFAYVPSFTDSANMLFVDFEARKLVFEKTAGDSNLKKLTSKNDVYQLKRLPKTFKDFIPPYYSLFKSRSPIMKAYEHIPSADVLIIFSNLTEADVIGN